MSAAFSSITSRPFTARPTAASRNTSLLTSVFSNWIAMAITASVSFIMVPVLVHGLGEFRYGIWVLTGSIVDYYGLLDLGIRPTLQRYVGRLKGTEQGPALNEVVSSGLVMTAGIAVLVLMLTAVLMLVLPPFLSLQATARTTFRWLLALLGLSIGVLFPTRLLGTYLCGLQRFDLYNLGAVTNVCLRALLVICTLRLGYSILGVGAATLLSAIFWLFLNWQLVRRADPEASLDWRYASVQCSRELAAFSFYAFLSTIGDYLRFYTDSFVIGRVLTISFITPFSIASRLVDNCKQVIVGLVGPLMPKMSALEGLNNKAEMRQLFFDGTRWSALVTICISSLLVINGKPLLRLWLGDKFIASYTLLLILVAGYAAELIQFPTSVVIYAKGRHRPFGYWTLAEGAANLVLSIYWARKYGLIGVALGTAVPMLITKLMIQPWYTVRIMRLSAWDYIISALAKPAAVAAVFLSTSVAVFRPYAPKSIIELLGVLALQTVLFAVITWFIGMNTLERRSVRMRASRSRP